jgi:hypothetical protein
MLASKRSDRLPKGRAIFFGGVAMPVDGNGHPIHTIARPNSMTPAPAYKLQHEMTIEHDVDALKFGIRELECGKDKLTYIPMPGYRHHVGQTPNRIRVRSTRRVSDGRRSAV